MSEEIKREEIKREEVEKMLPFYVTGRIDHADADQVRDYLERHPDVAREVDLVYFHELSVSEASTVLGIPEGTVKTRLFNARKRLSELLRKLGVDRGWP